jgi:uncharacterized phage protein (TIGR01671 family)
MSERYLFRGKRRYGNKNWITGNLVYDHYGTPPSIQHYTATTFTRNSINSVDPATIGQCTGLHDKNGTLIFEGDIGRDIDGGIAKIVWDMKKGRWGAIYKTHTAIVPIYDFAIEAGGAEIIGNIHDNPELLGQPSHTT